MTVAAFTLRSQIFIGIFLAVIFLGINSSSAYAIVGGEAAPQDGQKWMAGLAQADVANGYYAQFCGATLIDAKWVLTAAHCTFNADGLPFRPSELDVIISRHQLSSRSGERVGVAQIIRHPRFDKQTFDADIALLELVIEAAGPTVSLGQYLGTDSRQTGTVFGWGISDSGEAVDHLRQTEIPLVSSVECGAAYSTYGYEIGNGMFCAGYEQGGKDACSGDSGGPMVIRSQSGSQWVQIGIVSWGAGCGQAGAYGVYTSIAEFGPWIEQHVPR